MLDSKRALEFRGPKFVFKDVVGTRRVFNAYGLLTGTLTS